MFITGMLWLVGALGVTIHPPAAAGQSCHINVGTSSLAADGQAAVRFQFSRITNNINFILPTLDVDRHLFSVSTCVPTLYLLSTSVSNPSDQLRGADLSGTTFNCASTNSNSRSLDGIVVKFLQRSLTFDELIPNSWRSLTDNTVLLRLAFRQFPAENNVSYSCDLKRSVTAGPFTIDVEVSASISLRKVGCPRNRWGPTCSSPCSCLNEGECHTFEGQCLCRDEFTGSRCETELRDTTTKVPVTSAKTSTIISTQVQTTTSTKIPTTLSTEGQTTSSTQTPTTTSTQKPTPTKMSTSTSTRIPKTTSTTASTVSLTQGQTIRSTKKGRPTTTTTPETSTSTTHAATRGTPQQTCHIPVGTSALASKDEDAVRFTFSPATVNPDWIFPALGVQDHVYVVSRCYPELFLLSEPIPTANSVQINEYIIGMDFTCKEVVTGSSRRPTHVRGTVMEITQLTEYSRFIPSSWYSLRGNRVVLKLVFLQRFPPVNNATYRCYLDREVTFISGNIKVEVRLSVSLRKVGCPRSRWGEDCSKPCNCVNGGECHTFEGHCLCLSDSVGNQCKTDLKNSSALTSSTLPTMLPSTRQPTSRQPGGVADPGETSGFPVLFADPRSAVLVVLMGILAKLL